MTADLAAAQRNLAQELARRIAPTVPPGSWSEAELASWIERELSWIFEDVAEDRVELDNALVFAVDRVLQELNEPVGVITGQPWPPSRVVAWPQSRRAGVDTNRTPWAARRGDAIHFGYGVGETAALTFDPIPLGDLRG